MWSLNYLCRDIEDVDVVRDRLLEGKRGRGNVISIV